MKRIFGIILLVIGITLVGLPILTIFGISCSTDNTVTASAESVPSFNNLNQINSDECFSYVINMVIFDEDYNFAIEDILISFTPNFEFSIYNITTDTYFIENYSISSGDEYFRNDYFDADFIITDSSRTIDYVALLVTVNDIKFVLSDLNANAHSSLTITWHNPVFNLAKYFNDVPAPTPSTPEWTGNYYQDAVDLFASALGVSPGSFMYTVIEILAIFFCVVIIAIPLLFVFAIILWIISLIRPRC